MNIAQLIDQYAAGPAQLRQAVAGMSDEQLRARPVPGKWSTHEVVCHLGDFEPIYADRLKRIIATDNPGLPGGDENAFFRHLAYDARDTGEELALIEACRASTTRILRTLDASAFQRTGVHSENGPMTLEAILRSVTGHLPHHAQFVLEKRKALGL